MNAVMKAREVAFITVAVVLVVAGITYGFSLVLRDRELSGIQRGLYGGVLAGDVAEVEQMLQAHPDLLLTFRPQYGFPLHAAVTAVPRSFSMEMVEVLVESGDPNRRNGHGQTALMALAQNSHMRTPDESRQIAEMLLDRGGEINARDRIGFTALHWAVHARDLRLVDLLIKNGAEIDAVEPGYGLTPLHLACLTLDRDIAQRLINAGADAEAKDLSDRTPTDLITQDLQGTRWSWTRPPDEKRAKGEVFSFEFGIVTYRTNEKDPLKVAERERELTKVMQGAQKPACARRP